MNNYFEANPDVGREYDKVIAAGGNVSAADYALWHYDNHGRFDGRGGVLPTGQTTFERQLGATGGTFYDVYAGAPTINDPGVFVNPTRGQYSKNIDRYRSDYGDRYSQVGPWGQFETVNEAEAWAAQNAGKINSYMSGYKPTWIDGSKAAWGGSQAGNYDWQGAIAGGQSGVVTKPVTGSSGIISSGMNAGPSSQFTPWDVTSPQTVQGQAAGIIDAESPLMQQARGRAMQQMNERGLINSSLAAQAAQDAVMDRAIQIGSQDASTNASSAQFNANQQNAWNLAQQQMEYQRWALMQNFENQKQLQEVESKYSAQLNSDAAFQKQYAMYLDALFQIDMNTALDDQTKLAMKRQRAQELDDYVAINKLGINMDFSDYWASKQTSAPKQAQVAGGSSSGGSMFPDRP